MWEWFIPPIKMGMTGGLVYYFCFAHTSRSTVHQVKRNMTFKAVGSLDPWT
jgi:hypothetical protein